MIAGDPSGRSLRVFVAILPSSLRRLPKPDVCDYATPSEATYRPTGSEKAAVRMIRFRRPERYRKAVLRTPCKSPPGDTSPQRIVEISLSAVSKDPLSEIPIVQLDQRCVNQF